MLWKASLSPRQQLYTHSNAALQEASVWLATPREATFWFYRFSLVVWWLSLLPTKRPNWQLKQKFLIPILIRLPPSPRTLAKKRLRNPEISEILSRCTYKQAVNIGAIQPVPCSDGDQGQWQTIQSEHTIWAVIWSPRFWLKQLHLIQLTNQKRLDWFECIYPLTHHIARSTLRGQRQEWHLYGTK